MKFVHVRAFRLLAPIVLAPLTTGLAEPVAAQSGGNLDPSFGQGGLVRWQSDREIDALAVQPDARIVYGGSPDHKWTGTPGGGPGGLQGRVLSRTAEQFVVGRLDPSGVVDASFGNGGERTVPFFFAGGGALDLALRPDGRIVAAGWAVEQLGGGVVDEHFALARLLGDGSLDPTFGSSGMVTTNFVPLMSDRAFAVALQPDGRILAAGGSGNALAMARYLHDGRLDQRFGIAGMVRIDLWPGSSGVASDVALQPDGKIVVISTVGGETGFVGMARFLTNGTLDPSFAQGGTRGFTWGKFAEDVGAAVAVLPDGKILLGGSSTIGPGSPFHFGLARFLPNGDLDFQFGGGVPTYSFFAGRDCMALDMALQSDGRILLAGFTWSASGTERSFALARALSDGNLDPSFGVMGRIVTDFFPLAVGDAYARAMALQLDGRIVVGGAANDPTSGISGTALARYFGG